MSSRGAELGRRGACAPHFQKSRVTVAVLAIKMAANGNLVPDRVGTRLPSGPRSSPAYRWFPHTICVGCNTKAARRRHSEPDDASGCAGALAKAFPEMSSLCRGSRPPSAAGRVFERHTARSLELKMISPEISGDVCQRSIWFVVSCPWSVVKTRSAGPRMNHPRYGRLTICFRPAGI